jgi:hypothetical protein
MRSLGFCSALALALLLNGLAQAQSPQTPQVNPAPAPQVAPQAAPPATAAPAAQPATVTADKLKPPSSFLIDCKDAPKDAVLELPEQLRPWFTLYCTKNGHLFSTNDKFFSAFPGTGIRGAMNAGELGGRRGGMGHKAYFRKITYEPVPAVAAKALVASATPAQLPLLKDKPLFKIDLTIDNGQVFSLVVADPGSDPFWVFPATGTKLSRSGFYVATLDYVNRKR